jgi:hypothetical protein
VAGSPKERGRSDLLVSAGEASLGVAEADSPGDTGAGEKGALGCAAGARRARGGPPLPIDCSSLWIWLLSAGWER